LYGRHFESQRVILYISVYFIRFPFLQTNHWRVFETAITAAFQIYTYSLFMVIINEQLVSSAKVLDEYT